MIANFYFIYHKCMKGENHLKCDKCGKPMRIFSGYPYKVILTLQQGNKTILKCLCAHQSCFSKEFILNNSNGMRVKKILVKVYHHNHKIREAVPQKQI